MNNMIKFLQKQIENTRYLLKNAQSREETEAHIQSLEELNNKLWALQNPTSQKTYLKSKTNQGSL